MSYYEDEESFCHRWNPNTLVYKDIIINAEVKNLGIETNIIELNIFQLMTID